MVSSYVNSTRWLQCETDLLGVSTHACDQLSHKKHKRADWQTPHVVAQSEIYQFDNNVVPSLVSEVVGREGSEFVRVQLDAVTTDFLFVNICVHTKVCELRFSQFFTHLSWITSKTSLSIIILNKTRITNWLIWSSMGSFKLQMCSLKSVNSLTWLPFVCSHGTGYNIHTTWPWLPAPTPGC